MITTQKHLKALRYIADHIKEHHYSPATDDLHKHLRANPEILHADLEARALIRKAEDVEHDYEVTHYGMFKLREAFGEQYEVCTVRSSRDVAFYGKEAAQ